MLEDLIENYKLLSTQDKRQEILNEVKLMVAVFEKMCTDKKIEYRKINSREILDLKNGTESEDDYLEALFVYVEFLKEVSGSLLAE